MKIVKSYCILTLAYGELGIPTNTSTHSWWIYSGVRCKELVELENPDSLRPSTSPFSNHIFTM